MQSDPYPFHMGSHTVISLKIQDTSQTPWCSVGMAEVDLGRYQSAANARAFDNAIQGRGVGVQGAKELFREWGREWRGDCGQKRLNTIEFLCDSLSRVVKEI